MPARGVFTAFAALFLAGCIGAQYVSAFKEQSKPSIDDIQRVRVVFMNHLDVGFNGIPKAGGIGFAVNVINYYFDIYFPAAVKTAEALRERGGPERLIYTTDAWLVSLYVDPQCSSAGVPSVEVPGANVTVDLHCPSTQDRENFEAAIRRGDITWHAFPFNAEAELADPGLFAAGVALCQDLDTHFGKRRVTTMSQRDVPGITRASVPLLRASGVRALSVGVNGASSPPDVPTASVWRDAASQQELLLMYHPGGYGGIGVADCVIVDGLSTALAFAFRGDNQGPPDEAEVIQVFAQIHQEFGNKTEVIASTFDEFVDELEGVRDKLPVVTDEIGDTWIYGVQSDFKKVALLRAAQRERASWIAKGNTVPAAFDRLLLKAIEHTWGVDVKTYLNDWVNWSNEDFQRARSGTNYQVLETSWNEQRQYLYNAVEHLGNHHVLAKNIREAWKEITHITEPSRHALERDGFQLVTGWTPDHQFECGAHVAWQLSSHGSINALSVGPDRVYASATRPLGSLLYQTFDAADYTKFLDEYMYCPACRYVWAGKDFGKPNVTLAHPTSAIARPVVLNVFWRPSDCSTVVQSAFAPELHKYYGTPRVLWSKWHFDQGHNSLHFDLQWFDKTATRLPEAFFVEFNPVPQSDSVWAMDKMGSFVDPLLVVRNGSHHLHGVSERGVYYGSAKSSQQAKQSGIWVESQDVALLSPGVPSAFPTPLQSPPDVEGAGVSYVLYDNLWGTNYIMWYPWLEEDRDSRFRFAVSFA